MPSLSRRKLTVPLPPARGGFDDPLCLEWTEAQHGRGNTPSRKSPVELDSLLVWSVSAEVNTDTHRPLGDSCRRCPRGLRRSPHTSHPRSHVPQPLRPAPQPGGDRVAAGGEGARSLLGRCRLLSRVCAPRLVAQTSG